MNLEPTFGPAECYSSGGLERAGTLPLHNQMCIKLLYTPEDEHVAPENDGLVQRIFLFQGEYSQLPAVNPPVCMTFTPICLSIQKQARNS